MSLILAVDQAYERCSLALQYEKDIAAHTLAFDPTRLTRTLTTSFIDTLDMLCKQHARAIRNITHIVATTGPASFTGLRVVLAALQGIAFAHNAKVLTCSRLELDAFIALCHASLGQTYTSFLSNQRGAFFSQTFIHKKGVVTACNAVNLVLEAKEQPNALEQEAAHALLEWRHTQTHSKTYAALIPFYGQNPDFKKLS